MICYRISILNKMNRFENALFTFPVTRKHFFSDKVYSLYLFSDEILMTDVL